MTQNAIYAKSIESGVTLLKHTQDVVEAFRALFGDVDAPSRLGDCWRRFFKIADYRAFYLAGLSAAVFHDWGKANSGFEGMLRLNIRQPIRHEHLSALMMFVESVQFWRESRTDIDWDVVVAAVVSHHLNVTPNEFAADGRSHVKSFELLVERNEFHELLQWSAETLELPRELPKFEHQVWSLREGEPNRFAIKSLRSRVLRVFKALSRQCRRDSHSPRSRLVMAVRSALICADAAGSGVMRANQSISSWIKGQFVDVDLLTDQSVQEFVIDPRVAQIEVSGRSFHWSKFQDACENIPDRSLLVAPCGSGKTLAAWRKIAARCREPVQRVLFLYPTRATATEGFRDYVAWAPESAAALMHGKAEYDLADMFENPDDARSHRQYAPDPRLFAIGFWSKRVFSATVDQFLAFLQHSYGSTCLLPVLADSVVVIDEVHSFDSAMWSALKDFLNHFDVPVLCMTASLSRTRSTELVDDCDINRVTLEEESLQQIAKAPRYSVTYLDEPDPLDIDARISVALANGQRVLWVVNQTQRAQEAAIRFAANFPERDLIVNETTPLVCYHSRFRLNDRVKQHQLAVQYFQQKEHPALAITTQVCEMSLDLDADMIVTERAPVTSLIQRMGRCNRVRQPRDESGEVVIYRAPSELPYNEESMTEVDSFITAITAKPRVSQAELEQELAKIDAMQDIETNARFIQSGAFAKSGEQSFRDVEEFTAEALLDCDVRAFDAAFKNARTRSQAVGYITPAPIHLSFGADRHPSQKHLFIVPGENYHETLGFCKEPIRQPGGFVW